MATATIDASALDAAAHPVLTYSMLYVLFHARMAQAEKLEQRGATIKNRLYEARALELAMLMRMIASTPDQADQAEELMKQAEARAYNHKAVKEERAIRRAEFKAANPTATETE